MNRAIACSAPLLLAPAVVAVTPPRVEVSADGRETVVLQAPTPTVARAAEGVAPPFGAAPDWMNDVRRQIGGVRVADLDRDGRNEVVTVCYNSNSFPPYDDWHNLIYFNGVDGLETTASWTSGDEVSTGDLAVADFDGDGYLDVFAANGGASFAASRIYFGSASGPSTAATWTEGTSTWTNFAVAFDFDHDGFPEIVTANQGNSQFDPFRPMQMFENTAGVVATTPTWMSAETSIQNFLSFGDVDGDGWEDLAVSKWINFESGVYRNVAGTLATSPNWTTGDDGDDKGIAFADLDRDGDMDLALGHDPTRMYRNTAGVLSPDWSASGGFFGHSDLVWGDVDRDGDADLAEVHFANGTTNLYRNDGGTLGTTPWWSYDSSSVGTALAFGDVDGDGMPDIVIGYAGDPSVAVFYNQLPLPTIFADGFESGDTSAWAVTVP